MAQMILQVFSILYMVASFIVCLGVGYEWSYNEDRSFWNKRLLKFGLVLAFAVITNVVIFNLAKDNFEPSRVETDKTK